MFLITAIPLAIEQLNSELELVLESAAKEAPGDDQTTREIELTPDWNADFSLHGVWSAGILPAAGA